MARIRGGIGSAFHFRRPPIDSVEPSSREPRRVSGRASKKEQGSVLFSWIRLTVAHGRAGLRFMRQHIFKASLAIWPY